MMSGGTSEWHAIELVSPLPMALGDELRRRVFFIDPEIEDFECLCGPAEITGLRLRGKFTPASAAGLHTKINRVVEREILNLRMPDESRIWEHGASEVSSFSGIYPALLAKGLVIEMGHGLIGLAEPLISLMDALDYRLRAIAMSLPQACEYRYPTLIKSSVLERSGYFRAFPQFPMFVTRLHNDLDIYDEFLGHTQDTGVLPNNLFEYCNNSEYCLPPTLCYHYFYHMDNRRIQEDHSVTIRGKSFRHESRYSRDLSRLWDFTIREIVFVGSRPHVLSCRGRIMDMAFEMMESLNLSGHCSPASDHFFADNETTARVSTQRLMALKYELHLNTSADATIAVGSFNLHERHFTDAFAIKGPNSEACFSGCVGFGLERLTYAFLCQHGLESSSWPTLRRDEEDRARRASFL